LSLIVDAAPLLVAYVDAEQRIRFANRMFLEFHGLSATDVIGRPVTEVIGADAAGVVGPHHAEALAGRRVSHESLIPFPGGRTRWMNALLVPRTGADGHLDGFLVLARDVSARREAEEALRAAEATAREQLAEMRHVYQSSPVALCLVDRELRFLRVNEQCAILHGRPAEELIGRPVSEILSPPLLAEVESMLREVIDRARPVVGVERAGDHPGRPGERIIGLVNCHPLLDLDGQVLAVTVAIQDITGRKLAEQRLAESEARLASIVGSAMDAIVTIDAEWRVTLFNESAEEVFGCPAAEAMGRSFERFCTEELRETVAGVMRAAGRKGSARRTAWVPEGLRARRAGGDDFPVEVTVSPVQLAGPRLFMLILRDVNDRVRAEQERQKLELQNLYLESKVSSELGYDEIVGTSRAMREVLRQVELVAGTDATVLVTGETGTGKELVARAIHERSRRRRGVLVTVNCAALPAGLIESELFGHEAGAFTGALTRRIGRFETAQAGSIFLDEIGDLPLELQAKLLRVLQDGECQRVGGAQALKVDVRVIAATNQNLEQAVAQGRFRADLFYRLNVFPIRIPPLRERPEDVPVLARCFAMRFGSRMGRRIESIPPRTLGALTAYGWPGNVRELQNVIERAVILTQGPHLELGAWPPPSAAPVPPAAASPTLPLTPGAESGRSEDATLEAVERRHILEVLQRTGWRVSGEHGAARILGLRPSTLDSRMKRLGISRRAPS